MQSAKNGEKTTTNPAVSDLLSGVRGLAAVAFGGASRVLVPLTSPASPPSDVVTSSASVMCASVLTLSKSTPTSVATASRTARCSAISFSSFCIRSEVSRTVVCVSSTSLRSSFIFWYVRSALSASVWIFFAVSPNPISGDWVRDTWAFPFGAVSSRSPWHFPAPKRDGGLLAEPPEVTV